jgi:hypothetical protein
LKKNNNNKPTITTSKDITKEFPTQEGNPSEVVETSSILSEIGRKNGEILGEVITKP